ncbi:phosphoglucosamine mutase [Saccharopolyspora erythraea NRRL 2338]|uniref:Phosphoglucosamine mutase n=2 Tax=Saccharopolyspora erythraea TaxID=1836 RepID=GLMM_SACEN|nr:phosphoglucosamine mutase [Saccharopolyspora erythraea]A4FPG9.1 RecName: Full=Phosphoglucosamine mutase [Saccharopolyspora erythraea NRRL 2338]EQD84170.1 phosphoglucosamine mutase [Saccharopolyspora erythraea D]PFG99585.1 phosphoglucosamine mutase [Saccharopolyspora erythraea NRRL 2338]QRK89480.1 phosphoglucosamine mutase [Saccharopolyspora erythraea]CAM05944.1 putative phosphoglucomutase/phosphomannomutase [Saccharopolyspora erythraea NRRL 2338]
MSRLFGTDGVRGLANADLTPELALSVASAAARVLYERDDSRRRVALVGRDPRASGEMLEAAVTAGLTSAGADVLRVGVLPTPAVAHLVSAMRADLGVMISASHNPMPDNGIKLFAAGGHKLPDAVEDEIADRLDERVDRPTGAAVGRARDVPDAGSRYVDHLLEATPQPLDGLRVVVDCANGAAAAVAPSAYRLAGAEVIALNAEPDGLNINEGVGSTHLDGLRAAVREHRADLGLAHDGDADRCLAVDATGSVVDGDQIMAILAVAMKEAGELADDTLVTTVMSNLGLHLAMREHGVKLRTTAVGDRYVLAELREGGFSLGGEQSGHVVLPDHATTGDGLLTALRLMGRVVETGRSLAELAATMTRLPQVLVNVRVADKATACGAPEVAKAVAEAEAELGDEGRVLLRPSGTEQLVRVMVEARSEGTAQRVAGRLAELVAAIR